MTHQLPGYSLKNKTRKSFHVFSLPVLAHLHTAKSFQRLNFKQIQRFRILLNETHTNIYEIVNPLCKCQEYFLLRTHF